MPMENPIVSFLNKMADLLILNLLFVLCCIPIVTIGPALCAMYHVTLRSIRYGDGYVVKEFFKAFKQNFIQATVVWIINLIIILLFVADMIFWNKANMGAMSQVMLAVSGFFALMVGIVAVWIYPVIAKIENPIKKNLVNAAAMAVAHFFPYTLICAGIVVLACYFILTSIVFDVIMCLIGFALVAYIQSFFFYKVMAKYLNEESMGEDDLLYNKTDISQL